MSVKQLRRHRNWRNKTRDEVGKHERAPMRKACQSQKKLYIKLCEELYMWSQLNGSLSFRPTRERKTNSRDTINTVTANRQN